MDKKLQAKDLITIGVFTAIYYIIYIAVGMIGLIPIFMVLIPAITPIVAGIPFMLFLTKTHKFGMVTIMSIVLVLLMFAIGYGWIVLIPTLTLGVITDLILKAGKYKSSTLSIIGFSVFSLYSVGAMSPLWFARETFFVEIEQGYGSEYANALAALTPPWMMPVIAVGAFLGGILGGIFGKSILKKHFKKAGIV